MRQIAGPEKRDKKHSDQHSSVQSRRAVRKESDEDFEREEGGLDCCDLQYPPVTRQDAGEDSCSSFDYDEFGQIEVCYPDKLIIRPAKGVLSLDAVLFDQHGNFIGPVAEVIGGSLSPRYVIHIPEDIYRTRRYSLKPNDSVYYYNCDRLEAEPAGMDEEEPVESPPLEMRKKRTGRGQPKRDTKISKMILKSVINNLRNLSIDEDEESVCDPAQRDRDSQLANKSNSITSMIFKSYQDKSKMDSVKEQLKKRKYRKYKHRIIQHFYRFQEEATRPQGSDLNDSDHGRPPSEKNSADLYSLFHQPRHDRSEMMEDELGILGKRALPFDKPKRRKKTSKHYQHEQELTAQHNHRSSGSSRLSHTSEPSPEMLGGGKAVSEVRTPGEDSSLTLSTDKQSLHIAPFDLYSELGMDDELRMNQEPLSLAYNHSHHLPPTSHSPNSVRAVGALWHQLSSQQRSKGFFIPEEK